MTKTKTVNKTLSFTATPELKTKIEEVASQLQVSRSKAIATLITKAASEDVIAPSESTQPLLKQLSLKKAAELLKICDALPYEGQYLSCGIDEQDEEWFEGTQELFSKEWEPKIARFLELADEANEVLWQVDNSTELKWAGYSSGHKDAYEIVEKLFEYGLIAKTDIIPATGKALWDYYQDIDTGTPDNTIGMIAHASGEDRLDIIVSLCPYKEPVERGAYWRDYYTSRIGTEKADPWAWKGNTEATIVCEELTEVLSWEEPEHDVKRILEVLHEDKDPFTKYDPIRNVVTDSAGNTYQTIGFGNFSLSGKYGSWQPEAKSRTRSAFRKWYKGMVEMKSEELVRRCLEVIWGARWNTIQSLLSKVTSGSWFEILEVKETASIDEIKKAHKDLARIYHPDVNKSDDAERIMKILNQAKEQGLKARKGQWVSRI